MNDRELLEMAAKAAGYDGLRWSMLRQCFYDCSGVYWRPLDDDGDALRLAVKLMIEVRRCFQETHIQCSSKRYLNCISEPVLEDPYAATRRAIVRAAAEIGRGMK